MVDRDGDGLLDYQEFINLFMQKLEIWTSDRNSWFEQLIWKQLIETADLNSWFVGPHEVTWRDYDECNWATDEHLRVKN